MASHTLFVSNFPFSTTESELSDAFSPHCEIDSLRIITDRETGRSRGYAFIEVADGDGVDRAIDALNDTEFGGRRLVVNRARGRGKGEGDQAQPPFRHRIVIEWDDTARAYALEVPELNLRLEAASLEAAVRQLRTRSQAAAAGAG